MKPEELLDPERFPPDLRWIPEHYRLNPNDPVYLLLAWHWRRIGDSEEAIRGATAEWKAAIDHRSKGFEEAAAKIEVVAEALNKLDEELQGRPRSPADRREQEAARSADVATCDIGALQRNLAEAAEKFRGARRRESLATLLTGVTLGVLGALAVFGA